MGKIAKYGTHLVHISRQIEMNDFAMTVYSMALHPFSLAHFERLIWLK